MHSILNEIEKDNEAAVINQTFPDVLKKGVYKGYCLWAFTEWGEIFPIRNRFKLKDEELEGYNFDCSLSYFLEELTNKVDCFSGNVYLFKGECEKIDNYNFSFKGNNEIINIEDN